jgi:hypothetical protein
MAGPLVYEDGLFELSIDPSWNSLDNTFNEVRTRSCGLLIKIVYEDMQLRSNMS